jgi:hypothetical protein
MSVFETIEKNCDFCVIGGGLSGVAAAVAAARHGAKVILVQDRPMLGGNASSEMRMWVCGASGDNMRETGIIEEIMLKNQYRNPYKNYSIWDSVILETVMDNENITLLLNCSCMDGMANESSIEYVLCWQTTTQRFFKIHAKIFADCSGDSVLAPISKAFYRVGRESKNEFGEQFAVETADNKTMGMSCLIQARECLEEKIFIPPVWAKKLTKDDLLHRFPNLYSDSENFWYLELGGDRNSIKDTEDIRDELLKLAYGFWDFIKNDESCKEKHKNFDLDWIGILPGKRESRRYVGDYILTQNDVLTKRDYPDTAAYGGWPLDDHDPKGFNRSDGKPNRAMKVNSPYPIPFRCMYSKNISNLMFAGRNISATHTALSSSRVMATCAVIGQAVGTAAAIAVKKNITPRKIYSEHIKELQKLLMYGDCYILHTIRPLTELTKSAVIKSNMSNPENLRNGIDRPIDGEYNGSVGKKSCFFEYDLQKAEYVDKIRIVFDSDLNRKTLPERESKLNRNMFHNILLGRKASYVPKTIVKEFRVILTLEGDKEKIINITDNYQRLVYISCGEAVKSVKLIFNETHGDENCRVFAIDLV